MSHYYIHATSNAREVRDLHLVSVPKHERQLLKVAYEEFIEGLLARQKVWTAAYRKMEEGGHGYPKVMREGQRLQLLQSFFFAAKQEDWARVNELREELVRFGL